MQHFFETTFFGNSVALYCKVLLAIVLALLLRRFISKFVAKLLYRLIAKSNKNIHKSAFINLIIPPLDLFLLLLISFVALDKLQYPTEINFKVYKLSLFQVVDGLCNMCLILSFIWLCLRVIDFMAMVMQAKALQTIDQTDNQLVIFFKDFFKVILILIGVLLIMHFSFNKNIGNLITGLSIAGAAIALSTKESLENLIASFIIFFDKPFTVGDFVKVNNFSGTIEKIGLRSTRIRTDDKTYISVPNKQMVDSIIDNISLRTGRKGFLQLEISLATAPKQLQLISPAITKILEKPAIENMSVFLRETGKNAHVYEVNYYTTIEQNLADFFVLREQVTLEIINFLANNDIALAAGNPNFVLMNAAKPDKSNG
jgi:MscS family membrane protein